MYKLMLVDDEDIIRNGMNAMINTINGIRLIKTCPNAFDALECMMDEMPDILISDIKMPQMDGLELAERAIKMYPAMQVIILSGYDEFDYARRAIQLGVKEYILKPCEYEDLKKTLGRVCKNIDAARERVRKTIGDREEAILVLTEQLMVLGRNSKDEKYLQQEIQKLLETNQREDILVESLARIVALAEQKVVSAQWKVELLQSIFKAEKNEVIKRAAEILQQILLRRESKKPFVDMMCRYVNEHYMDSDLSLQYVADHVIHMNADYVGREFISGKGMKFSEYLLRVRMKHAQRLIYQNTNMHFYEIAEKVGYGENSHYFSLMFKKVYKMSPKEFRDKITRG